MKRLPLSLLVFTASTLFSTAFIGSSIAPAIAHDHLSRGNLSRSNFQSITKDLFYPRSSQRFFMQGRNSLETEIQQLQQPSQLSNPILHINPSVLQQQQHWQQQELRLEEPMPESGDRAPTIQSPVP